MHLITELADRIEQLHPEQFDMTQPRKCIGGWARTFAYGNDALMIVPDAMVQIFGIPEDDAWLLCYPRTGGWSSNPTQAARVLRHYATTGKIDWSLA